MPRPGRYVEAIVDLRRAAIARVVVEIGPFPRSYSEVPRPALDDGARSKGRGFRRLLPVWLHGFGERTLALDVGKPIHEARRITVGYDGTQRGPTTIALPEAPAGLYPEAVVATVPRTIVCRSGSTLLTLRAGRLDPIEGLPPCDLGDACLLSLDQLGQAPGRHLLHAKALVERDGTLTALRDLPGLERLDDEGVRRGAVVSLLPGDRPSFSGLLRPGASLVEVRGPNEQVLALQEVPHLFTVVLAARRGDGPAVPILSHALFGSEVILAWRNGVLLLDLGEADGEGVALDSALRRSDLEGRPRTVSGTMLYWLGKSPWTAWTYLGTLAGYRVLALPATRSLARNGLRAAPPRSLIAGLLLFVLAVGSVLVGIQAGFEGVPKPWGT